MKPETAKIDVLSRVMDLEFELQQLAAEATDTHVSCCHMNLQLFLLARCFTMGYVQDK